MSGTHDWIDNDTLSETDGMGFWIEGLAQTDIFIVFSAALH
jgi:hypothetical protein